MVPVYAECMTLIVFTQKSLKLLLKALKQIKIFIDYFLVVETPVKITIKDGKKPAEVFCTV